MTAFRVTPGTDGTVPLRARNGAPLHTDEQQATIVRSVVESVLGPMQKQHAEEMRAMREIAERMERGYANLAQALQAFVIGEQDLAVAAVVDGESHELPNLPRYKAEATVLYRLTATEVGEALGGVPHMQVSYLLGPIGLNWTATKETLWNQEFFRMTKRRLWHPDIVGLLAQVILDSNHPDRATLSPACAKRMDALLPVVKAKFGAST